MRVHNKVIVVTGGGNGIGRELVLNLVPRGAEVAAIDIREDSLLETLDLLGDEKSKASAHVVNITDREGVQALPEEIIDRHGAVDGLINNAGIIQPFFRLNDLDFADIERVMNVNFYGMVNMVKSFLPHLLKRPEGHIVNVSSMGGFFPFPGQSLYGASKAAVKLLTEGLHSELTETNVRVTVVFPGAIETNITANSGVDGLAIDDDERESSMPTTKPDVAAQMIIDGMERDKFRVLIGNDAKMMDLLYRLSPKRAAGYIYKQMKDLLPD